MLVGTDPEFIVSDGTKPVPFLDFLDEVNLEGFVVVKRDNVLLELNTLPAVNKKDFIQIQQESIRVAQEFILKEFGLWLTHLPEYSFESTDYRFYEMGCVPSYSIYEDGEIPNFSDTSLRFCGGHVHIGYNEESEALSRKLIRNLDYHVGLNLTETPSSRRLYYGQAGSYRREPHIKVEYRTPNNEWLFGHVEWMYDQICKAMDDTLEGIVHSFDHSQINKIRILC